MSEEENFPDEDRDSPENISPKMNRRKALSTVAKVAIGVGAAAVIGGAAYYASLPPATTTTTTTTTLPLKLPGPDHPLVFAIGGYRPDMVAENLAEFDRQFNAGKSELQQLSGDLIAGYQTKLLAGAPLDLLYSYPYSNVTWAKGGFVLPLDDIKKTDIVPYNGSEMRDALYKSVRDIFSVDGKFYGPPYYISDVGVLLTNEDLLERAGFKGDYPTTWSELYDQIEKIAAKGFEIPYLAPWYNEPYGIPWSFNFETMNVGGLEAMWANEAPYEPTFDTTTVAAEVLRNWKNAWDKGWVPKSVLTMKQTDFLGAFATGKYAYNPNGNYFLRFMNDPSKSQIAGKSSIVPVKTQPWGLIDTAAYSLVNRKGRTQRDLEYAQGLLEFFGYKDRNGDFRVARRWAIEEALDSGYAAVAEDPQLKTAVGKWFPDPDYYLNTMKGVYSTIQMPPAWRSGWYTKWNTRAQSDLSLILTGEKTVNEVITGLRDYATELIKTG